jgi:heme-degrading monooxygenase HmoA
MITVLIERHLAPDMGSTYEGFAKKIIQATVSTPGFISGESLHGVDDPNTRYIIVKMQSESDWRRWFRSRERLDLVGQLGPLLTIPEKIILLRH